MTDPPGPVGADFALAAYEPYGGMDVADFGDGGVTATDFNGGFDQANAIARAPEGKLVVAGLAETALNSGRSAFAVARYRPNGKLDRTFGGDGRVTTRLKRGDHGDVATGVVVRPDGRITVAGYFALPAGEVTFGLVRYLENGQRDQTFGDNGRVVTPFPGSDQDRGLAMAAAKHGKVIVAGESNQANGGAFALARYRPDGSLDSSFGGDGRVTTDLDNPSASANAVLVQPSDGRIVAAGSVAAEQGWGIARFRQDGGLDGSFNGTGFEIDALGASTEAIHALAIQGSGKIFAAGWSNSDFTVACFLSGGGLDPNFSGGITPGVSSVDFFGQFDAANAMVLQPPDGKPVLAGMVTRTNNSTDFGLARFFGIT